MIEAVNSVLANSKPLASASVQASAASARSDVKPSVGRVNSVSAPFISPNVIVDYNASTAVLQIRDQSTGAVVNQYPSQKRLDQANMQRAQIQQSIAESSQRSASQQIDLSALERNAQIASSTGAQIAVQAEQTQVSESAPAVAQSAIAGQSAPATPTPTPSIASAAVASAALASAAQTSGGASGGVSVSA